MENDQQLSAKELRQYAHQHAPVLNENFDADMEALRERMRVMKEQQKRRAELSQSINARLYILRNEIRELNELITQALPLSGVGKEKFADMFAMTGAERRLFMLEQNIGALPTMEDLPSQENESSNTESDEPAAGSDTNDAEPVEDSDSSLPQNSVRSDQQQEPPAPAHEPEVSPDIEPDSSQLGSFDFNSFWNRDNQNSES